MVAQKSLDERFVRKDIYDLRHQELETRLAEMDARLREMKSSRMFLSIASAVVGLVVAYLINYALTH